MTDLPDAPKIPGLDPEHQWFAETVRITAFPVPSATFVSREWKDIFGANPDQVLRQPMAPQQESGVIDGARWILTQQPDRIDVGVIPENPASPPMSPLNIGDFAVVMQSLLSRCEKIFASDQSFFRLAAGGMLFLPLDSAREGNRVLQTMVSQIHNIPDTARDIALQLNLPMPANDLAQGLVINRLVKWQIATVQIIGLGMGSPVAFQLSTGSRHTVIRMEIDINTAPERTVPIAAKEAIVIMQRLGDIACEIAKTGGLRQ